jgi:hypothetical protein
MEEQTLLVDSDGREWQTGTVQRPILVEKLIIVPIVVQPMHPSVILDPADDYIYCVCAKCNEPVPEATGYLCLYFSAVRWGVRIVCHAHYKKKTPDVPCAFPIIHVGSVLQPIIDEACLRNLSDCVVCDKPACDDETCHLVKERGLLYRNRIDELMAQFYRVKLDIISPLVNTCKVCGDTAEVACKRCKFVFCSDVCLKRKWHKCVRIEKLYV